MFWNTDFCGRNTLRATYAAEKVSRKAQKAPAKNIIRLRAAWKRESRDAKESEKKGRNGGRGPT